MHSMPCMSPTIHTPAMHTPLPQMPPLPQMTPATHVPPLPYMPPVMHAPAMHAPCHACSLSCMPPCHIHPLPCMPLPMDRMTDACENITFPQLLLRTVIIQPSSRKQKNQTRKHIRERPSEYRQFYLMSQSSSIQDTEFQVLNISPCG